MFIIDPVAESLRIENMLTYFYDVSVLDFNPFFRICVTFPFVGHPKLVAKASQYICRMESPYGILVLQQNLV